MNKIRNIQRFIIDFFVAYLWILILLIPFFNVLFLRAVMKNALLKDIFREEEFIGLDDVITDEEEGNN